MNIPKKRVLIVDHEEALLEPLDAALRRVGLEAIGASDCASAVDLFQRARPAAVLVRADLGDEDGRDVCTAIRDRPDGGMVPILFFGHARPSDSIRSPGEALAAGGDYFFRAPLDFDELAERVRSWTTGEDGSLPELSMDAFSSIGIDADAVTDLEIPLAPLKQGLASASGLRARTAELPRWSETARVTSADATTPGLLLAGEELVAGLRVPEVSTLPVDPDDEDLSLDLDDATEAGEHPRPSMEPSMEEEAPAVAVDDLPPILESAGPDVEALVREANALNERGERAQAIDAYEAAAALCEVGSAQGMAISLYRTILELDPGRTDIAGRAAQIAVSLGHREDALAIYGQAAERLESQGDLFDATEVVRKMLAIGGHDPSLELRLTSLEDRLMHATGELDLSKLDRSDVAMPDRLALALADLELPVQLPAGLKAADVRADEDTFSRTVSDLLAPDLQAAGLVIEDPIHAELLAEEVVAEDLLDDEDDTGRDRPPIAVPDLDSFEDQLDTRDSPSLAELEAQEARARGTVPAPKIAPAVTEIDGGSARTAQSTQAYFAPTSSADVADESVALLEVSGAAEIEEPPDSVLPLETDLETESAASSAATSFDGVIAVLSDSAPREPALLHARPPIMKSAPPPPPPPPPPPVEVFDAAIARDLLDLEQSLEDGLPEPEPIEESIEDAPLPEIEPGAIAEAMEAAAIEVDAIEAEAIDASMEDAPFAVMPVELSSFADASEAAVDDEPLLDPPTIHEAVTDWPDPPAAASLRPELSTSFFSPSLTKARTLRPSRAPLSPEAIPPAPFAPAYGELTSLLDALTLLVQLRAQRSTGILDLDGGTHLIVAAGEPRGVRGTRAVQNLIALLLKGGRVPPQVMQDLLSSELPDRPVELGRNLVARTLLREAECIVFLERHLDDALAVFLRHRGGWSFAATSIESGELVPATAELRERLCDLIPRAVPLHEVHAALGGSRAIVRVAPGYTNVARGGDLRLLALLDGRYALDEAAELAAIAGDRAAAIALVWIAFGLAVLIEPYPPRDRRVPVSFVAPAGLPSAVAGAAAVAAAAPVAPAAPVEAPAAPPPLDLEQLAPEPRLRALADVVRTSDYFAILGVGRDATTEQIAEAHRALKRLIRLEEFHRPELVSLAREVSRSLDEARDVLSVPTLRAAYQKHLRPQDSHRDLLPGSKRGP